MKNEKLKWIKWLTWFFIFGLVVSGATAIPLQTELDAAVRFLGAPDPGQTSGLAYWILKVRDALSDTYAKYPFFGYGFDWLAFGHFAIAIAFIGALREPVRNRWLYMFGMISCVLVIPYAFILGGLRGIPVYWRLIDCSFGVFGFIPLYLCWKWTGELEQMLFERDMSKTGQAK